MNKELTVVIPTLNEEKNIIPLVKRLHVALEGINWEVIFVDDDSSDGTADTIENLGKKDSRVQLIRRIGCLGLSSACIEGMKRSIADCIAVMDGDLQHDETLLKDMFAALKNQDLNLVIGSRYIKNATYNQWSKTRIFISWMATNITKMFLSLDIKDPLSGYFMFRRDLFLHAVPNLSGRGQKILLDVCLSSMETIRFKELPYQFRTRTSGKSKLNLKVIWDNFLLLANKPVRFFI